MELMGYERYIRRLEVELPKMPTLLDKTKGAAADVLPELPQSILEQRAEGIDK